jgi:tRNA A37 threonylcarbamoyladenosine biosynthesis protein TsaE
MHIATNSEIIDISLEVKTAELAKKFSKILKKGDIVFFHGEIGVGKTTFIRHLINCLQINNHLNQLMQLQHQTT